eukprot:1412276-Rhodomonas_salina.1
MLLPGWCSTYLKRAPSTLWCTGVLLFPRVAIAGSDIAMVGPAYGKTSSRRALFYRDILCGLQLCSR